MNKDKIIILSVKKAKPYFSKYHVILGKGKDTLARHLSRPVHVIRYTLGMWLTANLNI